ncbi:hypothetical protein [Pseudooceanicola sp. LIPI14-2-Ac024]|uniref:hypothetical protein n=1 Tax=Pseudooceanicola sp. LIPI14-2-Ac024 TaxID=3344875 RepID=UPI0035CF906C
MHSVDDAREAIVDAYYDLADALVMMPRPGAAVGAYRIEESSDRLSVLEEGLRNAARFFAREVGRNQYGDPDKGQCPDGSAREFWLARMTRRIDDLHGVRETGMTEAQSLRLLSLKRTLDEVTAI